MKMKSELNCIKLWINVNNWDIYIKLNENVWDYENVWIYVIIGMVY